MYSPRHRILVPLLSLVLLSFLFFVAVDPTNAQDEPQNSTPDLQPQWASFSGAVVGHEHTGTLLVYNTGTASAQNVAVRFYTGTPENGTPLGATQVITEIPAQQIRQVILTWTPPLTGIYTITAWLDPDNTIVETNENNNRTTIAFNVREANITWYVDQSKAASGNGRTPENAFRTIQEAIKVALIDDTIQVAAGIYVGSVSVPLGVALVGAGQETTVISGSVSMPQQNRLEHVTVYGSSGISTQGKAIIRNSRVTNASQGIRVNCAAGATTPVTTTIETTVIDRNRYEGISAGECASLSIRNTTIVSNTGTSIRIDNADSLVENNVIVGNGGQGVRIADGTTVRHNIFWQNASDSTSQGISGENLLLDPMLRDILNEDYRLYAGSPAIGSGNPPGTYIGALPFTPVGAPPTNVTVEKLDEFSWRVQWNGSAPKYQLYWGTQSGHYQQRIPVSNVQNYVLRGLPGNIEYFVTVSSDNGAGGESALSDESSFYVPALATGIYEETSSALLLNGDWRTVDNVNASGGKYLASSRRDDIVQLTFSGDSLTLYRRVGPDGGQARVHVDGIYWGELDFGFVEERWRVPAIFDNLGNGIHTLTLTVGAMYGSEEGDVVSIDAFAIPAPFQPSDEQRAAIERVNHYRGLIGLPPVVGVQSLQTAAQSHANFIVANYDDPRLSGLGVHTEYADLPGFTGEKPGNRAGYFGYTAGAGEVVNIADEPISAIDFWMSTVYHRVPLIEHNYVEIGYASSKAQYSYSVLNMGYRPHSLDFESLSPKIYSYPVDKQTNVPPLWSGQESPDPIPGKPRPVGYPVSLHIRSDSLFIESVNLFTADGQVVPSYAVAGNPYFLVPEKPLALDTEYTLEARGTITTDEKEPFDYKASFRTAPAAQVLNVLSRPGGCGAEVGWKTVGESTTWIEYGPSMSYGFHADGIKIPQSDPHYHYYQAVITDLSPNTTYHYRVVSRDAYGNERITGDRILRTSLPMRLLVPTEYDSIQKALNAARVCDTVQVEAGLYEGNVNLPTGVNLVGAGPEVTTIQGKGEGSVLRVADQTQISGFTIRNSGSGFWDTGIWINDNASTTISYNRITGNSMGIVSYCYEAPCDNRPVIHNNVIDGNIEYGINLSHGAGAMVVNNTIIGNKTAIHTNLQETLLLNNIIVNNSSLGIFADHLPIQNGYNNLWNNGVNYEAAPVGEGDLSVDPLFVDSVNGNYHLRGDSPLLNAGHPDPQHNDPDGSRNEIGAYGGPSSAANLSQVMVSLSPTYPKGGDTIRVAITLRNSGAPAQDTQLILEFPDHVTYVMGSASPAEKVTVQDNRLVASLGAIGTAASITVGFELALAETSDSFALTIPWSLTWQGGAYSSAYVTIANGKLLYLPSLYK